MLPCATIWERPNPKEHWPHHHGHGPAGVKLVEQLCQRLRIPNPVRDLAKLVAEYHDLIHTVNKLRPETLLKLFNAIDVWRKPERLEQMIMTSEADARGRTGFENNPYPQGDYLRAAFQIANGVSIQEVVASGLQGLAIRDELQRRRQQALAEWKQTQETASI